MSKFQRKENSFLNHIITTDRTWVRHFTPELKQVSKKWRKKGEPRLVKTKLRFSAGKVMATAFCYGHDYL